MVGPYDAGAMIYLVRISLKRRHLFFPIKRGREHALQELVNTEQHWPSEIIGDQQHIFGVYPFVDYHIER